MVFTTTCSPAVRPDVISVAESPSRPTSTARVSCVPFATTVTTRPESYVVASAVDNTVIAVFDNHSMATGDLADRVAADVSLAGALHVIPAFEAAHG